jgi:plastocyanin
MQVSLLTAAVAVGFLVACADGENQQTNSAGSTSAESTSTVSTAATPTASTTLPAAVVSKPVTGKMWHVKMLGDAKGYRFDPASLTIKAGDGVQWTVVSGPPHNVTFWPDSIPAGAQPVLQSAMQQTTAPLTSPLLMTPDQTYTISFAGAPTGTYHYYCTPHLALGMVGKVIVQ